MNKNDYVIGVIKKADTKKQTLASFLSSKEELISEEKEIKRFTYTFDSVFPNKEIRDEVLEVLDQMEKEKYYKRLGIPLDSQEDVSWERLIELDEEMRREQKPKRGKFLSKIIKRRGV